MADYTNSAIMFRNDKRITDKHPTLKGDGNISCPHCGKAFEISLAAWTKIARNGSRYLTISFRDKDGASRLPTA